MAKKDTTPLNLRPYQFHGMEWSNRCEDEMIGTCIACGKEEHFFVNRETGVFNCRRCGEKGNKYTFLDMYWELWANETTGQQWDDLSGHRSLPVSALKAAELAYDAYNERWLIPVRNPSSGEMYDLRVWTPGDNMNKSTKGMKSGLWNAHQLLSPRKRRWPVWVCEGEWDGIALLYLVRRLKLDICVVAVPGAGTFKTDWPALFKGRDVVLAYDNDKAGEDGLEKASTMLAGLVRSVSCLRWLAGHEPGYDLRDVVRHERTPAVAWSVLESLLDEVPVGRQRGRRRAAESPEDADTTEASDRTRRRLSGRSRSPQEASERPSIEQVFDAYARRGHLTPDLRDAIKVSQAVVRARTFMDDPLWVHLVGTSGGGKTMLTNGFRGCADVLFQSSLSRASLVSGFHAKTDPSLIARLDEMCLVVKDFTEILSQPAAAQEEIFSTLRGAFDGDVNKAFGNESDRNYVSHFSFLAGCTPIINSHGKASMGERFLKFQLPILDLPDQVPILSRAIRGIGKTRRAEAELEDTIAAFQDYDMSDDVYERVPGKYEGRIIALSQLISCLRAEVVRDEYRRGEVLIKPITELGTRLAKQLAILGCLLAEVSGDDRLDEDDYRIVERMAFDTANTWHLDIVTTMSQFGEPVDRATIVKSAELPKTNVDRKLDDLQLLKVIECEKRENTGPRQPRYFYSLTPHIRRLWEESHVQHGEEHRQRTVRARRRRSKYPND